MLRVLLKVENVKLKVREQVDLHILIRKDHHHFTHCRGEPLRDGQARLTNSSEFLIEEKNPKFDLDVFLIAGQTKKKGGTVSINLKAYTINASHRVIFPIRKTPLADSTLAVDFMYMLSDGDEGHGPLVSLHRSAELQHHQHLKVITTEHEKLVFHNDRLNDEIRRLKQKNQDLSNQRKFLEQSMSRREEEYSQEIMLMEKQREKSLYELQSQRQKVAQIMEKINESGDKLLKMEMDKMINDPSSERNTNN